MPRSIDNLEDAFTEMYEFITDLPSGLDDFESDFDEAFKELENLKVAIAQPSKPLTLEQLREMGGQLAWCEDVELWAIVSVSDAGRWKGVPFALFEKNGARFEWNIEDRELSLYPYPPAQQRWIPVSEEEPGRNQDVLICTRDGQMQVQRWWQIKDYDIATHWMPLPEPPEEG